MCPPPPIRCFISAPLLIKSDLAEPPSPLPSDVIYGRSLMYYRPIFFEKYLLLPLLKYAILTASLYLLGHDRNFALENYGPKSKCFDHNDKMWEEMNCEQVRQWQHW